ncbi:unnamed protein product [Cercopithifilaria johnstoni]|uniref:Uncharacterized protein n=1 Tax=Cercopithifilaria johnstoni TaxID=2874296 RepID=A0A8J2Q4T5_9BILA|nr:unnamed protein product [Cercopithifilaria johnstoni]
MNDVSRDFLLISVIGCKQQETKRRREKRSARGMRKSVCLLFRGNTTAHDVTVGFRLRVSSHGVRGQWNGVDTINRLLMGQM